MITEKLIVPEFLLQIHINKILLLNKFLVVQISQKIACLYYYSKFIFQEQ